MSHLQELLGGDLSKASRDALVDGVRQAELLFDQAQVWSGRLIAELRRRGESVPPSWAELSKMTGVPSTTLRNRVATFERDQ